jgi:hypothetical protein
MISETTLRISFRLLVLALALPPPVHAANPFDWLQDKLRGKSDREKVATAAELRDRGPISLKPGEPVRFLVGDDSPDAELPKGHSHFRRVEMQGSVAKAHVRVTVLAQDAESGRTRSVFKPVLYLLDEEGNVRKTVEFESLEPDLRAFKRTQLVGCATADDVQRLLVATPADAVGKNYESAARDAVKAPTQSGFFYSSTEGSKLKLPYAATGELVLDVIPAESDKRPCAPKKKAGDEKPKSDAKS